MREQIYSLSPLTTRPSALIIQENLLFYRTPKLNVSILRASGGIRTPDQLITNQLLWPTELHWQLPQIQSYNELPTQLPGRAIFWEGKGNGKCLMEKF